MPTCAKKSHQCNLQGGPPLKLGETCLEIANKVRDPKSRTWHGMRGPMHEEIAQNYFDQCLGNHPMYEEIAQNCFE
jgi:hypothetical protein